MNFFINMLFPLLLLLFLNISIYRVVQQDFIPEIGSLCMLFEGCLGENKVFNKVSYFSEKILLVDPLQEHAEDGDDNFILSWRQKRQHSAKLQICVSN